MKLFYKDFDQKQAGHQKATLLQCTEDQPMEIQYAFSFEDGTNKIDVVAFEGTVYKLDDAYYLRGAMALKIDGRCDRCLAPAKIAIATDVDVTIEPHDMPMPEPTLAEYEMSDDDGDIFYSGTEYIDIEEILRQEALLVAPVKKLCKPECKGVCPYCGADLNVTTCNCTQESELSQKLSAALHKKPSQDSGK